MGQHCPPKLDRGMRHLVRAIAMPLMGAKLVEAHKGMKKKVVTRVMTAL